MNGYINSDDEATCPGGCNQTVGMCLCAYQSCDDCNLPADQCVCPGLAYVQLAPDGEVLDCDHVRVLDVRREPYYIIDADGAVEKSGGVVVFDLSDFEIFDPPPGVSGDDHLRYLRCKIMSLVPKALRAGAYEYAYDGVRWLCDNFVRRDAADRQCAWADYRKDYGVGESEMAAAHKAFMAGWKAAREGDQSGPLR